MNNMLKSEEGSIFGASVRSAGRYFLLIFGTCQEGDLGVGPDPLPTSGEGLNPQTALNPKP